MEKTFENWDLEEVSNEEFENLANELLAWYGIGCGGNKGPDDGKN